MGIQFRKELLTRDDEGQWHLVDKYQEARNSTVTAYGPYDAKDRCFYCYDFLSGEAVLFWMGSNTRRPDAKRGTPDQPSWRKETYGGQDLLLHPGCFLELTTRLFSDLHRIELIVDYHMLKNASPVPPRPVRDAKQIPAARDGAWRVWRTLRNAMRDLTVVSQ